jgi:hypothetical protein
MFKKSVILLSFFVYGACGDNGCDLASCDTVATTPVVYSGLPNATSPYISVGHMSLRDKGCTGSLCSYWAGLRPVLHNPTFKDLHVFVQCRYYLNDQFLGSANPAKTVVVARTSRKLEGFDLLFDIPVGVGKNDLYAQCAADFGSSYNVSFGKSN